MDLPVGGEGCQPNILIAFVKDGEQELDELRKAEPKLFATLLDYEYDRIKRGNGAVRAWHGTQLKGKDGRDFTDSGMGDAPLNNQYSSSRLSKQVRVDMTGAIVIIDSNRVPGKTLQQLADYASMRAFVSIDDTSTGGARVIARALTEKRQEVVPDYEARLARTRGDERAKASELLGLLFVAGGEAASGIPTILSLFEEGTDAPDGMTTFDRAYLETVYRLPATANDSQIHDATWTMYRKLEGLPDIDGYDD